MVSRYLLPVGLAKGPISKAHLREYILLQLTFTVRLLSSKAILETRIWSLGVWSVMWNHGYLLRIVKGCS